MSFPEIKTKRFLLRQINKNEDLNNIYKGLSHPEVIKYYGVSYSSLESAKEQMNWYSNLEKSKTGIWWAISSQDRRKFYGAIGLYHISKEHKKAEIGFWLLPEYWGKGFVPEAMEYLLPYATDNLKLHRIEAFVESENNASANALKKLRFQFEGRMKDSEIKKGKFISVDIFAFIKEEGEDQEHSFF